VLKRIYSVLYAAVDGFITDNALSHAAAISFYSATSLAPVLLIVIAIAGIIVGHDAAFLAVSAQMNGLLGTQGAELLQAVIESAANKQSSVIAAVLAVATIVISASGVFGEMQASLNKIWRVAPLPTTISALVRARVASLGLVAALGFLLLVSLAASAGISALSGWINMRLPFGTIILSAINTLFSLFLLAALFGAIFKILPDRALSWRNVGFGALTTAVLFTVGKSLIGWYLGTSAVASSYGAAGSLIVLLLWLFYSSCIFLFGAELTRAISLTQQASLPPVTPESMETETPRCKSTEFTSPLLGIAALSAVAMVLTSILLRGGDARKSRAGKR
jgi:membrane protein